MVNLMCTTSVDDLKEVDVARYVENPDEGVEIYDNVRYIDDIRKFLPSLLIEGYLD